MGTTSFTLCPGCNRHVRCGERACPFCGVSVASFACVLEYRIKTGLDRSRAFSLGAALTAAGFATSCETATSADYGAPCNPPSCVFPSGGTSNGGAGTGGFGLGGAAGTATGGAAGAAASGGNAGSGGVGLEIAGAGGSEAGGAAGSEVGGAAGSESGDGR